MQHFANLEMAHICRIWALLIIYGSVVVILALAILQGKCKAGIGKRLVIGDQFMACTRDFSSAGAVISGEKVDLGVDHG